MYCFLSRASQTSKEGFILKSHINVICYAITLRLTSRSGDHDACSPPFDTQYGCTYKTRVRNRSDLDNEAFFHAVMHIQNF